jgi:hypothetical protein
MAGKHGAHRVMSRKPEPIPARRNFFNQDVTVLLIGGTIYQACRDRKPGYLDDLALMASGALYNHQEEYVLRPEGPVLLDASYLVSILGGLYGRVYPEQALRIMKRELISLEINPQSQPALNRHPVSIK